MREQQEKEKLERNERIRRDNYEQTKHLGL